MSYSYRKDKSSTRQSKTTILKKTSPKFLLVSEKCEADVDLLIANLKVNNQDTEFSWFGFVNTVQEEDYTYLHLYDIVVPAQDVTASTTKVQAEDRQALIAELTEAGRQSEICKMRLWGHSHVNMAVNPSGVDETEFEESYSMFQEEHEFGMAPNPEVENNPLAPFYIMWIQNKKGEITCDVIYDNIRFNGFPVQWESQLLEGTEGLLKSVMDSSRIRRSYNSYSVGKTNPYGSHTIVGGARAVANNTPTNSHVVNNAAEKKSNTTSGVNGAKVIVKEGSTDDEESVDTALAQYFEDSYNSDIHPYGTLLDKEGNPIEDDNDCSTQIDTTLDFSDYYTLAFADIADLGKMELSQLVNHYQCINIGGRHQTVIFDEKLAVIELLYDYYYLSDSNKIISKFFEEFGVEFPTFTGRKSISAFDFYTENQAYIDDVPMFIDAYEHYDRLYSKVGNNTLVGKALIESGKVEKCVVTPMTSAPNPKSKAS